MAGRRDVEHERGDSLIELVISIAILGIAVVAIFSGIALSIRSSDAHRKQTTAGVDVRSYAEAIENAVAANYVGTCSPNYASTFTLLAADKMKPPAIVAVSFWNGTTFPALCNAATDVGLQKLTLQVASTDGRATEKLVVIVRKPCGGGSTC